MKINLAEKESALSKASVQQQRIIATKVDTEVLTENASHCSLMLSCFVNFIALSITQDISVNTYIVRWDVAEEGRKGVAWPPWTTKYKLLEIGQ
jgi:hypothetical protein